MNQQKRIVLSDASKVECVKEEISHKSDSLDQTPDTQRLITALIRIRYEVVHARNANK